jgi:hypothetical protein
MSDNQSLVLLGDCIPYQVWRCFESYKKSEDTLFGRGVYVLIEVRQ